MLAPDFFEKRRNYISVQETAGTMELSSFIEDSGFELEDAYTIDIIVPALNLISTQILPYRISEKGAKLLLNGDYQTCLVSPSAAALILSMLNESNQVSKAIKSRTPLSDREKALRKSLRNIG
jgi:hypothetical protein